MAIAIWFWIKMRKQIIFSWLYFILIYLSYAAYIIEKYDVERYPISLIGWDFGGMRYLVLYIFLTIPYGLYQLLFLNRYFAGNKKVINIFAIISSSMMIIGGFIPLGENGSFSQRIHTFISVSGSAILMLTALAALVLHAIKQKYRVILVIFYILYAAALLQAFYVYYTAALFQFMASLSFFTILLIVNTSAACRKIQK